MKKILSLFSCLLLIGCGEKPSSEGSESASEKPTPSNESAEPSVDTAKPPPADPPVAESANENPTPSNESAEPSGDTPNWLSDADVERLLKEAVDITAGFGMGEDGRAIHLDGSGLLSGWVKWHEPEYGKGLQRYKDGQMD
ncbi:MAG: hypothetical protein P8M65_07620 [Roseibacillus sp.]|nr:hypothetical protein [Roseibacillus sp.]